MIKIQMTSTMKEIPIARAQEKDLSKIRPDILSDLLDGINDDKEIAQEAMREMSFYEAFDTWLRYNGIIGYTDQILRCQNDLQKAGFGFKVNATVED